MGVIYRKLETYEYTQYLVATSGTFNDENEFFSKVVQCRTLDTISTVYYYTVVG